MEYAVVAENEPLWSRGSYQANHRRALSGDEIIEYTGGTELKCSSNQQGDARWIHWSFFKNSVDEYILKLHEKCLSEEFKDCVICISVFNKIIDITFFSDANEVIGCLLFDDGLILSIKFSQTSSDKSIFANYINDGNVFSVDDLVDKKMVKYSVSINTQQKNIKKVSFLSIHELIIGLSTGEIMQISISINKDEVTYTTALFGKIIQKLFNVIIGNPGKLDIIDMGVYSGQFLFVLYSSGNVQLWDIKTKSMLSENSLSHNSKILNGKIRMKMLLNNLCVVIGVNYENNSDVFFCTCTNSNIEAIEIIPLNVSDPSIQDLSVNVIDLNFMPKANGIDVIYKFGYEDNIKYQRASCDFGNANVLSLNESMKEDTFIVDKVIDETDTDTIMRAIMRPNRFRRNDIIKVMRRYYEIPDNTYSIVEIIEKLYENDDDGRYYCNILVDLEHLEQFDNRLYCLLPLISANMTIVVCNDDTGGIVYQKKEIVGANYSEMRDFVDKAKLLVLSDNNCSQQFDRIKYGIFIALKDTYDTSSWMENVKSEVLGFCRACIDNNLFFNYGAESFKLSNILSALTGKSDDQIIKLFEELLESCTCDSSSPVSILPVLSCLSCNIVSGITKKVFGQNIDNSLIVAIIFAFIHINGGFNSNIKTSLHSRFLPSSICNIARSSLFLWLDTIRPCTRTHDALKYINTINICPSSIMCPDVENVKISPNFSVLVNFYRNTIIKDETSDDLNFLLTSYLMKSGDFSCLTRLLTLLEYQHLVVRHDSSKFTSLKLFVQLIDRVCYYHAEHNSVDDNSIKLLESIKYISNKLINIVPESGLNTFSPWLDDTKARVDKTYRELCIQSPVEMPFSLRAYDSDYGNKIINIAHLNNLLETSKRLRVLLPNKIGTEIALNSCYALLNAVIELSNLALDARLQTFLIQELHQIWFHIFEISLDGNLFDEAYTAIIEVLNLKCKIGSQICISSRTTDVEALKSKCATYTRTCIDCISSLVTKVCDYGYLGWLCKISIPSWYDHDRSVDINSEIINTLRQLSDDIFVNNSMSNSMSNSVRKQLHYYECLCCFLLYRQRFYDVHRTLYPLIKGYLVGYDYNSGVSIFTDREKVEGVLNTLSIIMHSIKVVPSNQAFILDNMDIVIYENLVQIFQQLVSVNVLSLPNTINHSIQSYKEIVIMLCEQNSLTQALNFCHHIKKLYFRIEVGSKVEGNYRGRGKWCLGKITNDHGNGAYDIKYDDGNSEICVKEDMIRSVKMAVSDVLESYYQIILDKIIADPSNHGIYNDLRLGGRCTTAVNKTTKLNASINILMDILCHLDKSPSLSLHKYVCNKLIDKYDAIPPPVLNSFWKNSFDSIVFCDQNGDQKAYESKKGHDVAFLIKLLLDKGKITIASEVMSQFLEEIIAVLKKEGTNHICEVALPNTILDRLMNISMSKDKIKKLLKEYYTLLKNNSR